MDLTPLIEKCHLNLLLAFGSYGTERFTPESDIDLAYQAKQIAPSTELRNRLVHEYETINDQIVFESISETIGQYTLYMREINKYIEQHK